MIDDSGSNQTASFYDGIVDVFNEKAVFLGCYTYFLHPCPI
jgi:hypothetical protein